MISLAGPSRPVITLNKAMTHIQAYIPSRLTVSRDRSRKQLYPNKTSPHPLPQDNISETWLLHQCSLISNCPPPPYPSPHPPTGPLPSDDNHLEKLDPKGCPPLGRKSHPSYRIGQCVSHTLSVLEGTSASRLCWLLLLYTPTT